MTKKNQQARRDAVLYRRLTVGLAAIGLGCMIAFGWQSWYAWKSMMALVPEWCYQTVWIGANCAVIVRWARKAVQ